MNNRQRKPVGPSLPKLDQFEFHAVLADMTGPTLIMFTSPDCGSCRHLRRVLQDVNGQEPDWQVFEVDAQRDPALVHEFEVFHLPTIFLFDKGEFHSQLEAAAGPAAIISATRSALLQPAGEAP